MSLEEKELKGLDNANRWAYACDCPRELVSQNSCQKRNLAVHMIARASAELDHMEFHQV